MQPPWPSSFPLPSPRLQVSMSCQENSLILNFERELCYVLSECDASVRGRGTSAPERVAPRPPHPLTAATVPASHRPASEAITTAIVYAQHEL